jgi:ATP-dependent DNA ligase
MLTCRGSDGAPAAPGNDLTHRFSLIVEALARLCSRSSIIDGEAVCCSDDGVPSFDRIRYRRHDATCLCTRST